MADPYVDPSTGVLRNRLGITDADQLAQVEADMVWARELELYRYRPVEGRYDLAHLRDVHRHLFAEVYDWAGELRAVDMAKGRTMFARPQHVEPEAHRVFDELAAKEHLRGLDRQAFTTEAGRLLGDLNALHPFRDGNGRTQRGFLQLLARDAGWQLSWDRVDPADNAARSAVAMADRDALVPLLEAIVSPAREPLPPESLVLPRRQPPGPRAAREEPSPGPGLLTPAQLAAQDRTAPLSAVPAPGPAAQAAQRGDAVQSPDQSRGRRR